jgi:hypothetical protein
MKHFSIIHFGLIFLTSCTYRPHEKRLTKFGKIDGAIFHSFYRKVDDTIEFKRFITSDSKLVVQSGQIFLGKYALIKQRFVDRKEVKNKTAFVDSTTTLLEKNGFVEKLSNERDEMFIQIVPGSKMGTFDALRFLNLRQQIEVRIDEQLKVKNLGEWFAGDMGAGGNMLFFIDNWDSAIEAVIEVLKEENLIDHVLIAKRIMTSPDDWSYEVVYPLDYEGVFNPL